MCDSGRESGHVPVWETSPGQAGGPIETSTVTVAPSLARLGPLTRELTGGIPSSCPPPTPGPRNSRCFTDYWRTRDPREGPVVQSAGPSSRSGCPRRAKKDGLVGSRTSVVRRAPGGCLGSSSLPGRHRRQPRTTVANPTVVPYRNFTQ